MTGIEPQRGSLHVALRRSAFVLLCPTRALMNYRKHGQSQARFSTMIRHWNRGFLVAAAVFCGLTYLLHCFASPDSLVTQTVGFLVFFLSYSRCNETMIAFVLDARDRLAGRQSNPHITPTTRIGFVIQSYGEIELWFALAACYLPNTMYNVDFHLDIMTAIYFSGVTISTLGYGDILPIYWLSRFLSLYEVFSGLFLLVVAISVYLSQSLASPRSEKT